MSEKEWRSVPPPNEQMVEVKDGRKVVKAQAIWGRDGLRPHWKCEDGTLYEPAAFSQWRPI